MEGKKVKGFKDATFMSTIRWRLVEYLKTLDIETIYTYGYLTKSKRIELGLEKTHYNDAYCIALNCCNCLPKKNKNAMIYTQIRRNNRSLEKFYDSKYIDKRDNLKKSGKELYNSRTTRNKTLNSENLHQYRGNKISKGRRTIRKQRYKYQPNDLIKYNNNIYIVKGIQNKGDYIKLKNFKKVIKVKEIKPYRYSKGFSIV